MILYYNVSTNNVLVHELWKEYPSRTWASEWHELFPTDDRGKLTWQGRFEDVSDVAYNFYSSGDEVLELCERGTPDPDEGGSWNNFKGKERYAWHKQEVYKGRAQNRSFAWAATDWSGWSFRWRLEFVGHNYDQPNRVNVHTPASASALSDAQLRTNTVFRIYPDSMNSPILSQSFIDENLAKGIPALSPPIGSVNSSDVFATGRRFDMNNAVDILRPNFWWRLGTNPGRDKRWLHEDLRNVAYYFVHGLFDKLVLIGELK